MDYAVVMMIGLVVFAIGLFMALIDFGEFSEKRASFGTLIAVIGLLMIFIPMCTHEMDINNQRAIEERSK